MSSKSLTNNEVFLFDRQSGGDLAVLNCFPNDYEVGMASLGYQTIFKLFASNPKTHTSRYFTNFHEDFPKNIDLVTFSVSWELDFLNIIKILKELNIPLKAKDRDETHPLVFAGGPCLTANPEPWADFFDFIAVGDAEDNVGSIIDTALDYKQEIIDSSRDLEVGKFAKIPGVYVPSLQAHSKIERQKTKASDLAGTSVLAPDSFWSDTYLLEVVRSCPEMCRFCLASYASLPFRAPELEGELIPKVKEALKYTNNIGLLGASVTQHPEFIDLLKFLLEYSGEQDSQIKVQIASVRASTVTKEMTDLIAKLGGKSLTIAIESGSQRLRDIINKKLPEECIFAAAKAARESGLKAIKLYGMVGLPYETDEDIDATIDLLTRLKAKNKTLKITWGCSIFTPKAQTPFQDFGVDQNSEKKLKKLAKALKPKGIDVRPESYKWAQVQALISRGDRTINDLMIDIYDSGKEGFGIYTKLFKKQEQAKSYGGIENYNHFVFDDWTQSIEEGSYQYPWQVLVSDKQSTMLKDHFEHAKSLS